VVGHGYRVFDGYTNGPQHGAGQFVFPEGSKAMLTRALGHKPVSMIFGMVDSDTVRMGVQGDQSEPWVFSLPLNITAELGGKRLVAWQFAVYGTVQGDSWNFGGPGASYQRFLVDYVRNRYGKTEN
jgi:hypothetical protein